MVVNQLPIQSIPISDKTLPRTSITRPFSSLIARAGGRAVACDSRLSDSQRFTASLSLACRARASEYQRYTVQARHSPPPPTGETDLLIGSTACCSDASAATRFTLPDRGFECLCQRGTAGCVSLPAPAIREKIPAPSVSFPQHPCLGASADPFRSVTPPEAAKTQLSMTLVGPPGRAGIQSE